MPRGVGLVQEGSDLAPQCADLSTEDDFGPVVPHRLGLLLPIVVNTHSLRGKDLPKKYVGATQTDRIRPSTANTLDSDAIQGGALFVESVFPPPELDKNFVLNRIKRWST